MTAAEFPVVPPRSDARAGETGAVALQDAVGRPVACGDIVRVAEGDRGTLGVVLNAGGQHLLVHHGDGTQSVLPSDEVIVVQRVPRKGTGTGGAL